MKKPDPAILRTSYLSNEIAKRTPKSHETIHVTVAGLASTRIFGKFTMKIRYFWKI
jgi:hypothetical protein